MPKANTIHGSIEIPEAQVQAALSPQIQSLVDAVTAVFDQGRLTLAELRARTGLTADDQAAIAAVKAAADAFVQELKDAVA